MGKGNHLNPEAGLSAAHAPHGSGTAHPAGAPRQARLLRSSSGGDTSTAASCRVYSSMNTRASRLRLRMGVVDGA